MKTLAEITCLTAIALTVILFAACSESNPLEATMDLEKLIQPTKQERRIYDPVRIEHWEQMGQLEETICLVISTGAITANTHEAITIIQSQIVNPPATEGEKVIPWAGVISAYNLTTEDAIERPPE